MNIPSAEERDVIHKELDLIESVISRMANNSFMLKGWTVTLVVGVIALYNVVNFPNWLLYILLGFVVVFLGMLDAFYLLMERKYTALYSDVRKRRMAADYTDLYSLNAEEYNKESIWAVVINKKYKGKGCSCLLRNTILMFYGSMLIVMFGFILADISMGDVKKTNAYEIKVMEANVNIADLSDTLLSVSENVSLLVRKTQFFDLVISENSKNIKDVNGVLVDLKKEISDVKEQVKDLNDLVNKVQGDSLKNLKKIPELKRLKE